MNTIIEEEKKKILMKNNELIKTRYSFSVIENRVFMLMLYKLQKAPNGEMMCEIPRSEFKEITKKPSNHTVKGIIKILDSLLSKKISFKIKNESGKGYEWNKHNLINGFSYNDETDVFKLICSERIYNLLISYFEIDKEDNKIFKGHTPINLKIYLSLENTMSQRMYELLRLWSRSKHEITYNIDDIKELFMIEDKYDKYNDFKKKIIEPSVNSLNNSGAFKISYKENKTGRKITSVTFLTEDLDERVYFKKQLDTPEKPQNPSEDFYIPDSTVFTKGTLILFKKDFKEYDFKEDYAEDAFYEAVAAIFEKDNVEKVYGSGYKYFKQTLLEKIDTNMMKEIREKY